MGRRDCGGPRYGEPGGYECLFPPTTQAMVEVRMDMEHDTRGLRGVLPDQLYPGNRPPSTPERVSPGYMEQHRPLLGSGLPPWSHSCQALTLPWEVEALSTEAAKDPERIQLPVCRAPRGHPNANLAGMAPPSVDLTKDLAPYENHGCGTPEPEL